MTAPTIALAGNPNVGKSTVFNALTGSRQHVGNWPGKTVAKKAGTFSHGGQSYVVVDLPGTYSLSAFSPEEQIARDFLIHDRPQLVVNVIDTANLERNLYLTAQILEIGLPIILVLNMCDVAESRGLRCDAARLSQALAGSHVISLVASRGQGMAELRQAIAASLGQHAAGAADLRRMVAAMNSDDAGASDCH